MSHNNTQTNTDATEVQTAQTTAKHEYPAVKPRVDIYHGEEGLLVVADLPGVARKDLNISLHGDELTIEGTRGSLGEEHGVITEFRPTNFKRSFTLREKIDADNITAQLKDGVLQLMLPKSPELKPRQIAINNN